MVIEAVVIFQNNIEEVRKLFCLKINLKIRVEVVCR